jgi:hypothetical protein
VICAQEVCHCFGLETGEGGALAGREGELAVEGLRVCESHMRERLGGLERLLSSRRILIGYIH